MIVANKSKYLFLQQRLQHYFMKVILNNNSMKHIQKLDTKYRVFFMNNIITIYLVIKLLSIVFNFSIAF
jgi:hypothetical protein